MRNALRITYNVFVAVSAVLLAFHAVPCRACPFCKTSRPTLSQMRESAVVVALGERVGGDDFRLHQILKGETELADRESIRLSAAEGLATVRDGRLAILFGDRASAEGAWRWRVVAVDETSYAYFVRAPLPRVATRERLAYFLPRLEHADPLIAEDAFAEFGFAPFDEVERLADRFSFDAARRWLLDPAVPSERKGFYALVLGLARDAAARRENSAYLESYLLTPADDFRAGFDGAIAGYLLATGEPGLALVEKHFLANPAAAQGDLRHSAAALRFYWEFGHGIPPDRLRRAMRLLLWRPELTAAVVVDLARWEDWDALDDVLGYLDRPGHDDAATSRAILGFLLVCPTEPARRKLAELRASQPERVAEAERYLSTFGGGR